MAITKIKTTRSEMLSEERFGNIPNKLTRETIEKALKGIDVESVDGIRGLFENIDD